MKNIKQFTDKWQMVCRKDSDGLTQAHAALHTFSILYCRLFKGVPKQPQMSLETLHLMKAVWDEQAHRVVEHPNSDEISGPDKLAAQLVACLPWVKKQFPKMAWKLRKRGAISVLLRSLPIGLLFYPLLLVLDLLTCLNFDSSTADVCRAHYEMRRLPTPISYIRGKLKMLLLNRRIKRMSADLNAPPVEDYLLKLKR